MQRNATSHLPGDAAFLFCGFQNRWITAGIYRRRSIMVREKWPTFPGYAAMRQREILLMLMELLPLLYILSHWQLLLNQPWYWTEVSMSNVPLQNNAVLLRLGVNHTDVHPYLLWATLEWELLPGFCILHWFVLLFHLVLLQILLPYLQWGFYMEMTLDP